MPQIVQFFHPGKPEIKKNIKNGIIPWKSTLSGHARKLLYSEGKIIDGNEQLHENVEVTFWGEWEADAEIDELKNGGSAKRLFKPFVDSKNLYEPQHNQNTDPLVLGKNWYYSNCKQERVLNSRLEKLKLKELEDGSIIIFGSVLNGEMVIDTVFVVKKSECYSAKIIEENKFLYEITLSKLIGETRINHLVDQLNELGLRLYFGKKYDEGEPYSFVPAKIIDGTNKKDFARPTLALEEFTCKFKLENWQKKPTGNHARWIYIDTVDKQKCKEIWNYLKNEVINKNLVLGVDLAKPKIRYSEYRN